MLSDFGFVLLFIVGALALFSLVMAVAWIVRPNRPSDSKLASYESGEESEGNTHVRFSIRYYVVALIFVLFEVELLFLFPWATVFSDPLLLAETQQQWGWFTLAEVVVFISVLVVGLVYAWVRGFLDWEIAAPEVPLPPSTIPEDRYEALNHKYKKHELRESSRP